MKDHSGGPHRLIYVKAWSPLVELCWEGLEGGLLGRWCVFEGDVGVSKAHAVASLIFSLPFSLPFDTI